MPKDSVLSRIRGFFMKTPRLMSYKLFTDYQGNFEIYYPDSWRFDQDVALENGRYTICFESKDGRSHLTVALETRLPAGFDLAKWANENLGTPQSGFIAKIDEARFRDHPAYAYSCELLGEGGAQFFSGIAFKAGDSLYSISWGGPMKEKDILDGIFIYMLDSLNPIQGRRRRA